MFLSTANVRLADLRTCSAQFYSAADSVVILEGGGVKAQGNWEAVKNKVSSSISKFSLQHQTDRAFGTTPSRNPGRLNAQLQVRQEAQADLARKTGDLGLYR